MSVQSIGVAAPTQGIAVDVLYGRHASVATLSSRHSNLFVVGTVTRRVHNGVGRNVVAEVPKKFWTTVMGDPAHAVALQLATGMYDEQVPTLVPVAWDGMSAWRPLPLAWGYGGNAADGGQLGQYVGSLLGHPFYGAVKIHDHVAY
jgi:hypothetical protein